MISRRKQMSDFAGIVRPCPFCGGEDLEFWYAFHPNAVKAKRNETAVHCLQCGSYGPGYYFPESFIRKDEGEPDAVRMWNDRIGDAPMLF